MTRTEKYKSKREAIEKENLENFFNDMVIRRNAKKIKAKGNYKH